MREMTCPLIAGDELNGPGKPSAAPFFGKKLAYCEYNE